MRQCKEKQKKVIRYKQLKQEGQDQGNETRELWRHICYRMDAAILEIEPICDIFCVLISL